MKNRPPSRRYLLRFFSSFSRPSLLFCPRFKNLTQESAPMEWTTPQHEEIDLNCEISSYANAEL